MLIIAFIMIPNSALTGITYSLFRLQTLAQLLPSLPIPLPPWSSLQLTSSSLTSLLYQLRQP